MKATTMKSVQYFYTIARKTTIGKVYLEELPNAYDNWDTDNCISIWTKNKKRASLVTPATALRYKNQFTSVELDVIRLAL